MTDEFKCKLCDELYGDYHACKSHVYMKHGEQEQHCGIPKTAPDMYVQYSAKGFTKSGEK